MSLRLEREGGERIFLSCAVFLITQLFVKIYRQSIHQIKAEYCDESVSRGRETGTKGREIGTKGRRTGTIGTKERGNEKPYGLVQIDYWDRERVPAMCGHGGDE